MLPLYCIEEDIEHGRLIQLLTGYETEPKPVYAILPHLTMPQKSRLFVEFCRGSLKQRQLLDERSSKLRAACR